MAADALMATLVVTTLGRCQLQEREARGLRLLSAAVIYVLGLAMVVRPELLE